MGKPKDAKVWNEDLVQALRARANQARQQGKQIQITYNQGADQIEAVRQDIYQVRILFLSFCFMILLYLTLIVFFL